MMWNPLVSTALHKGKAMVLALFLLLWCTACHTPEVASMPESNTGDASGYQLEYLSDRPETDGYSSPSGYYRIITRENATANLCYIDYATNQELYLCNQPNCTHDSESCPSFIPFSNGVIRPIPVGEKVVLLHGGNPSYADFLGEDALCKVEVLNADGSNRHTIVTFSATEQISQLPRGGLARDNRYVYFVLTDTAANARTLYRVDIVDETAEAIYSFDQDEERIVACSGDDLIIAYTPGANDISLDAEQLETTLFRLNPETKQETPLFKYSYNCLYAFDGELFATLDTDGLVCAYDLSSGKCLFENRTNIPIDLMTATFYGSVDGHLLITIFDMPMSEYEQEELLAKIKQTGIYTPHYYAIDIRTGEVKELSYFYYHTKSGGDFTYQEGAACFIAAETENQYMCCSQMNTTVVDFPKKDGTLVELPYQVPVYAMVSKEQFWDGNGTLAPVKAIS